MSNFLIVDDDVASCRTLQLHFRGNGHDVNIAHSVNEALTSIGTVIPDLIILDIRMPGKDGFEGLSEFKEQCPDTPVIMITAFHDMESTIQAMKNGADDYIHKPIDIHELDEAVVRGLVRQKSQKNDMSLPEQDSSFHNDDTMVGRSRAMKEIFKQIGLVAPKPITVLLTGESGTGKELVARAIHNTSDQSSGPFVAVNCAALVETLLESELFGHEKGAFTGAVSKHSGKFTMANNGTLFLDEIGELPLTVQAKLLRVLQEKEYIPVGGNQTLKTNARIIAATNIDLVGKVNKGLFREDLYYRIQVVTMHLPPLRERREDILDLVQTILFRINKDMRRKVDRISMDVMTAFLGYDWPGNVRELQNVLLKAVATCTSDLITRDLIPDYLMNDYPESHSEEKQLSEMSLEEMEKSHVARVLEATGWHRGKACEILGVSRPRLRRIIKQYKLIPPTNIQYMEDSH